MRYAGGWHIRRHDTPASDRCCWSVSSSAVVAGAERFFTDNRRDFTLPITEIEIRFPE